MENKEYIGSLYSMKKQYIGYLANPKNHTDYMSIAKAENELNRVESEIEESLRIAFTEVHEDISIIDECIGW